MSHVNPEDRFLHFDNELPSQSRSNSFPSPTTTMAEPRENSLRDSVVRFLKTHRQVAATAPAACVAVLAGAPLENIKTRMQSKFFPSALACTKYTYRTEGLRGFWVGTWSPLVSLVVTRSAQFQIYRWAKYKIDRVIERTTGESPLQHVNTVGTYPNLSTWVCFGGAGMLAGGLLAPVLTPVELVKNCAQTSVLMAADTAKPGGGAKNVGRISSYQAVQQIVRERGVAGLFVGFRLHLVRDVVGSGIYFGVYEALKQSLNSAYGVSDVNAPGAVLFAGAACGVLAWCVTYPLDSMKTRSQNRLVGTSAVKQAAAVAVNEASKAKFSKYKGIEMVLLRSALQGMIQQSIFEEAKRWIDELKFSDGSTKLPNVDRQLGRDQILKKTRYDDE
ncbi:hypothetical protein DV738_g2372, partial [Chaetothyriales sp. CBS 135597]